MDANPGYPAAFRHATNESFVAEFGVDFLFDVVSDRLMTLSERDAFSPLDKTFAWSAIDYVFVGACDPIRPFVKNEPHSLGKISEGRYRLIMNLSIVDQIIEQMLYRAQNQVEILHHREISSKPGMGLHNDGLADVVDWIERLGPQAIASDMKGYDFGVTGGQLMSDAERRVRLTGLPYDSLVGRAIRHRVRCLSKSVFVFGNGVVFEQVERFAGIQKSGSAITASANSYIRSAVALEAHLLNGPLVDGEISISMGDDCIERAPFGVDLAKHYSLYGWTFEVADKLEFCSTSFDPEDLFFPQSWARMVYKFMDSKPKDETERRELVYQLEDNLRHFPRRDELFALLGLTLSFQDEAGFGGH